MRTEVADHRRLVNLAQPMKFTHSQANTKSFKQRKTPKGIPAFPAFKLAVALRDKCKHSKYRTVQQKITHFVSTTIA